MVTTSLKLTAAACTLWLVACGWEAPTSPGIAPPTQGGSAVQLRVYGKIRHAADSAPAPGVTVAVYRITDATSADVRVASGTSGSNGAYSVMLTVQRGAMYGLRAESGYQISACAPCPVWPLPEAANAGGWLALDLWVYHY